MNNLRHILLIPLLAALMSSCVMRKNINYLQEGKGIPEYTDSIAFADYTLQRGDYVYVRINSIDQEIVTLFNGPIANNDIAQFNSDDAVARLYLYLVEEDGCIDYPYIGKIPVVGKTLRETKHILTEKLGEMIQDFSLDVRLANRSFSIIGEAGSGRYNIPREKTTIFEALAMSGDLKLYSKRNKVQLIRQTPDGAVVKTFDLRAKSIIDSEYYYIQPGDVLYIPFQDAKYWGAQNFTGVLSVTIATVSFGLFIYSIVNSIVKTTTATP